VISAAAMLLIVVTGAFALSAVTTMRFVGVGMIIALLLDATIVRMLLVPALLGLLGNAAWWAPGPLRRLQERAGLAEYAGEELFPTVSVGRHAAPDALPATSSASTPPRHGTRPAPAPAGPPVLTGVVVAGSDVTPWVPPVTASASVPALPGPAAVAALPAGSEPVLDVPVTPGRPIEMPATTGAIALPAAAEGLDTSAVTPEEAAAAAAASAAADSVSDEEPSAGGDESPGLDETVAFDAPGLARPEADRSSAAPVSPSGPWSGAPGSPASPPPVPRRPSSPGEPISTAPSLPRFAGTTPPIGPPAGSRPRGAVPDGVTFEESARPAGDPSASRATGDPSPSRPAADPEQARPAESLTPAERAPADRTPADRTPAGQAPADDAADQAVDDLHGPTVNLASRVTPEDAPEPEDPSPETTAVLEVPATVDLSSRREPASEDSRPRQ
jgi:RND superfamily putative drug exporter